MGVRRHNSKRGIVRVMHCVNAFVQPWLMQPAMDPIVEVVLDEEEVCDMHEDDPRLRERGVARDAEAVDDQAADGEQREHDRGEGPEHGEAGRADGGRRGIARGLDFVGRGARGAVQVEEEEREAAEEVAEELGQEAAQDEHRVGRRCCAELAPIRGYVRRREEREDEADLG